jgi:hypothetical protein
MSRRRKLKAVQGARGTAPADLPASREVWEADVVTLDDLELEGEPLPFELRVTLVVEDAAGVIVGTQMQPSADDAEAIASTVLEAMTEPLVGDPRRPAAVRIRRSRLAPAVAARLPAGVDVELADTLPCVAAAMAEVVETILGPDGPEPEPLPRAAMKEFFDAAATFYEAAPWAAIGGDAVLEVTVGDRPAVYGTVLSEDVAGMTGIALHESLESLHALHASEPAAGAMSVLFFMPESSVPALLVEERRRHRWRVAGPAAFPALTRLDAEGLEVEPNEAELRRVGAALRAVAHVVSDAVRAGTLPAGPQDVTVKSLDGVTTAVRIDAGVGPGGGLGVGEAEGPGAARDRAAASAGVDGSGLDASAVDGAAEMPLPEVVAVVERVQQLPSIKAAMTRYAWSFFRAPGPLHTDGEAATEQESLARFTEWVFFAARPSVDGPTLAEQALEAARAELGDERVAVLLRMSTPRHSVYRVVEWGDDAFSVDDLLRGERLTVTTAGSVAQLEPGDQFIGNLFPYAPGGWALGSTVATVDGTLDPAATAPEPSVAALEAEALVFGASDDWLDEIETVGGLRDAWQEFREDLTGGGIEELPTFGELQQQIREADSPVHIMRALAPLDWWSLVEAELCAHFIDRAWHLTPRDELAGRSPHAHAAAKRNRRHRAKRRKR